jgi:hypothetical protein
MPRFLANENVSGDVVASARQAGHGRAWIVELSPATTTCLLVNVLAQAVAWERNFSVAEEGKVRVVPLPEAPNPARTNRVTWTGERRRGRNRITPHVAGLPCRNATATPPSSSHASTTPQRTHCSLARQATAQERLCH